MALTTWLFLVGTLIGCLSGSTALELRDVVTLAERLAKDRLWAGMYIVTKGDRVLVHSAAGDAIPELGFKIKRDHIAPLGSNSKLFTAISIYQLRQRGLIDVNRPAQDYADKEALGLPASGWCARVADANGTARGPCTKGPTVAQLLRMTGGIVDVSNCHYSDPNAWQLRYCQSTQPRVPATVTPDNFFASVIGVMDPATALRTSGALKAPLEFAPGTSEHYSNEAFVMASHIVEHVSGMPIGLYFQEHIFKPLGLNRTYFDISMGQTGLYRDTLPYPSYVAHLAPIEISLDSFYTSYLGKAAYGMGTLTAASLTPAERAAIGAGQPGRWVKTARQPTTSNYGIDLPYYSGSGAVMGSPRDMATWLRTIVNAPEKLNLTMEVVKLMLNTSTQVPVPTGESAFGSDAPAVQALNGTLRFAQGVVVVADPTATYRMGVKGMFYLGSAGGFTAAYYLRLHPTDPREDVFAFVMTTTETYALAKFAPSIARNATLASGCALSLPRRRTAPVPAYMCDATQVLMGQTMGTMLLDKLLAATTGAGIFGLRSPWMEYDNSTATTAVLP